MPRFTTFLSELKRRRIYHVAVVYAAGAFVAGQAAEIFLPRLGLPDWTVTLVVVLAVAGFPVAIILGWAFDITPEGVRRTGPAPEATAAAQPGPWRVVGGTAAGLVVLAAGGWWLSTLAFGPQPPIADRLAVLPLANLTNDPERAYFVDGMHDALIGEISQVPTLLVISRQSVLQYRDSDRSLPAIANELGVDALVVGSVYLAGDSVRINVQLVRAQPEAQLWAATYHRALPDALARQGEVARAIAHAIRATISPEVEDRLARAPSVRPAAQDAYLRAIYYHEQATIGGPGRAEYLRAAIENLQEAIALEPDWATAHARLAGVFHSMIGSVPLDQNAGFFEKSRAAALRALELDEREAGAHAALGFVQTFHERDFVGAERSLRRALELDPNSDVHAWRYAMLLQTVGRYDEAVVQYRRAQQRFPMSIALKRQTVNAYHCAGQHEEAIAEIAEIRRRGGDGQLQPGDLEHMLGTQYVELGRYREATTEMERAVAVRDSVPQYVARLAWAHARSGDRAEARTLLHWLEARDGRWAAPELHVLLGDTDRALTELESLPDVPGVLPVFLCQEGYRLLRDHPRAQEVARRMGLPV